jgi:hypothetical protein
VRSHGELDRYFEIAQKNVRVKNVIITGYPTHNELRFVFSCFDVGVPPKPVPWCS